MSSTKILYVEDDDINIFVMKRLIGDIHDLEVVNTGEEAIDLIKDNDFRVILLDINLGSNQMDGQTAMHKLREIGKNNISIVALTSYAMPGDKQKFLEAGFDGYLSKPIEKETVLSEIERVINL